MRKLLLMKNRMLLHDPVYRLCRQGKILVETVILYVLYAGIYQLYCLDTDVREEISGWRLGRVYGLKCGADGPELYFMKTKNGIRRISSKSRRRPDVCFRFKSVDQAFQVVTGQISVADAYARHAFALAGDIGHAMSFARVVDRTELYLFPTVMTRRILKRLDKRQVPMVYVYLRILAGMFTGAYRTEL
ncbi:MAG: hypothetical protein PUG60_12720 [Lachnospiraceae bacterium]|nr:hypothetical protein [Lachnospiraceae bacterium]MDY4969283.1 hypothetical protein [Lachnospiraceae bacterium]